MILAQKCSVTLHYCSPFQREFLCLGPSPCSSCSACGVGKDFVSPEAISKVLDALLVKIAKT